MHFHPKEPKGCSEARGPFPALSNGTRKRTLREYIESGNFVGFTPALQLLGDSPLGKRTLGGWILAKFISKAHLCGTPLSETSLAPEEVGYSGKNMRLFVLQLASENHAPHIDGLFRYSGENNGRLLMGKALEDYVRARASEYGLELR